MEVALTADELTEALMGLSQVAQQQHGVQLRALIDRANDPLEVLSASIELVQNNHRGRVADLLDRAG